MKTETVNVPEQGVEAGLIESRDKIVKLLREMNDITFDLKDEAKQDQLLELNEKIFQEVQALVSVYHAKATKIKNILSKL